ncbi:MAG TPA: alpha-L-fucosidase [Acidimicrobiales bacterium]|nr:alpha-L-fucosidase [Acidimicrobiales bacterium]
MSWFDGAGLGMFVHWDHASQQGLEISWPLVGGVFAIPAAQKDVTVEQYQSSARTFDPREWDAAELARRARAAGMTYAVFTAKHHAGHAMFHTELSDFSIEHTPFGRDIVAEFTDAMREEGLRVGIYFSLSDWHHADYPPFTEADKPYTLGFSPPLGTDQQHAAYLAFLKGQLTELLTKYGRIDLLWFDGGWERRREWWRPDELERLIRGLQPDILINDRLAGVGDFTTPEQFIPPSPPDGRWETCMTMNESWGHNPSDTRWKSARHLVHSLCEVTAKGGNLLLNVSPTGTGALPGAQVERLGEMARWMELHGESVRGVRPGLAPWQFYGPSTRTADGSRVYLHVLARPYEAVTVRGVPVKRITAARAIGSGIDLTWQTRTSVIDMLNADPSGEVMIEVPEHALDPTATVIALDFEGGVTL